MSLKIRGKKKETLITDLYQWHIEAREEKATLNIRDGKLTLHHHHGRSDYENGKKSNRTFKGIKVLNVQCGPDPGLRFNERIEDLVRKQFTLAEKGKFQELQKLGGETLKTLNESERKTTSVGEIRDGSLHNVVSLTVYSDYSAAAAIF